MATTLDVKTTTLITKGKPSPSRVTSPSQLRNAKLPFSQSLARDIEDLSQNVNSLHGLLSSQAPAVSQILVKNPQTGSSVALTDLIDSLKAALGAKQDALTRGDFTETVSAVLVLKGNIGAIIGSGLTIQVRQASGSQNGYLGSGDWNTFNNKQDALTFGNVTEATSAVLTITGGTGAVIGAGLAIQVKQASAAQAGYLSPTDWSAFNAKLGASSPIGNLQGVPVSAAAPASGQTLAFDGSEWVPATNFYDVDCSLAGKPADGATVLLRTFVRATTFAANFTGTRGTLDANPTGSATYSVKRNGTQVGTVVISTAGVFTFATTGGVAVVFAAGDRMEVTAPSPQDATLSGVAVTFVGTT